MINTNSIQIYVGHFHVSSMDILIIVYQIIIIDKKINYAIIYYNNIIPCSTVL